MELLNGKYYINVERLVKELLEICTEVRDQYKDDDVWRMIEDEYSDDYLEEYAWSQANAINSDMEAYLNMKDHHMAGNFNNIEYDYPKHITGNYHYDSELVNAMIARLNAGEKSEQADSDRDFLTDWFWDTFGSFGIRYNFSVEMSETAAIYENETEEELESQEYEN